MDGSTAAPERPSDTVPRLEWDRRTQTAFAAVEREAREGLTVGDPGTALVRLITFCGRVPFDRAIRSLGPWERAIAEGALGRTDVTIRADSEDDPHGTTVVIAQGPLGKASFYRPGEPLAEGDRPIAVMVVPLSLFERADDIGAEEERLEAIARAGFDSCLQRAERGGRLPGLVADVRDRVDHVESVYVYVGRRAFCRSDVGNTLLRGGGLERLEHLALAAWDADERLFVAAFHVLFLSGRSIRIEEFNGEQLTATRLRAWLRHKWRLYRLELGLSAAAEAVPDDVEELGREVGALRTRLEPAGTYGFRRINGLTMAKHEFLGRLDCLDPMTAPLPEFVREHVSRLGVDASELDAHRAVECATGSALAAGDVDAIQRLLERIVLAAVLATGADYGMSSGMRDLGRLRGGPLGRAEGLLSLTKADFFCATLPHPSLVDRLDAETMFDVLHSVSKRMQFNRWHFLPGNLAPEEVPAKRHFFYPPVMPDITEWSDLRHPGHTNASVRYTVRAPGPALWRPPLSVFGLELRGCFDIRLVRMTGRSFTRAAVRIACQHCDLVDALWRAITAAVQAGEPSPPLSGFTRGYYEEANWSEAVRAARKLKEVAA